MPGTGFWRPTDDLAKWNEWLCMAKSNFTLVITCTQCLIWSHDFYFLIDEVISVLWNEWLCMAKSNVTLVITCRQCLIWSHDFCFLIDEVISVLFCSIGPFGFNALSGHIALEHCCLYLQSYHTFIIKTFWKKGSCIIKMFKVSFLCVRLNYGVSMSSVGTNEFFVCRWAVFLSFFL